MRVSFDLDRTIIPDAPELPCEPRIHWGLRMMFRDEPLRAGAVQLFRKLRAAKHEVWILTSSRRPVWWIQAWLFLHRVRVDGVVLRC